MKWNSILFAIGMVMSIIFVTLAFLMTRAEAGKSRLNGLPTECADKKLVWHLPWDVELGGNDMEKINVKDQKMGYYSKVPIKHTYTKLNSKTSQLTSIGLQ